MKIHNCLPLLLDCLHRWESLPSAEVFEKEYAAPMSRYAGDFFEGFHGELEGLNWGLYREEALRLDPRREEDRVKTHLQDIEKLFGFELRGEIILMGAFTSMDGYARFDKGGHRVFLGVDESHGRGRYLDVLITHELTHVARESRPEVWEGFGLNPKMTQSEFTENMPVIEHLLSEGFSCVVSEILVPRQDPWGYAYQNQDSLASILQHGPAIDRCIHREILDPAGDYGNLYDPDSYVPAQPVFSHYVWAWQWSKQVLRDFAQGDPRKLVARCAKDFVEHALEFKLKAIQ